MSMPPPSATREPERRAVSLGPIRLSTFLLLTLVAGLLIAIYVQRIREARLRDAIAIYRNPQTEAILDALDQPITLTYDDDAPLDLVLKEFKLRTTKNPKLPGIPTGIPIYVDPIGLQEAEVSLNAAVKRPPFADAARHRRAPAARPRAPGPGIRSEKWVPDDLIEGIARRARRWCRDRPLSPVSRHPAVGDGGRGSDTGVRS